METEVIMQRELFGLEIAQKSKTGFLSATDLLKAGNKWRALNNLPFFSMDTWLRTQATKDFIESLTKKYGKVKINSPGKNRHTWVHPFIFIDMALAISPELKIEVYTWLYDHLLKYRNESGDSYRLMTGAIYELHGNKYTFPKYISSVAEKIKLVCHVDDWNKATAEQLEQRDKIHDNIALLCDVLKDCNEAVRLGILKSFSKKELAS
jgi:hypothetical protein